MNNPTTTIGRTVLVFAILALPVQAEEVTNEADLVSMYAPVLSFHPNEGGQCCYPSDAEEAYARLLAEGSLGEVREPDSLLPNTPCYFQIAQHLQVGDVSDFTRIKYWFWYNFNDFPEDIGDIGGSHPGDWESVEVMLVSGKVYAYMLSNHEDPILVWPGEAALADGPEGTHIKVWVGNGSHANYPSPTYEPYCVFGQIGTYCDEIKDGGSVWYTMDTLQSIAGTSFADYRGKWGDPVSPVARQFENSIPARYHCRSERFDHGGLCDVTFGPGHLVQFATITATCPAGGCIRFTGEPFGDTLLWSVTEPVPCRPDIPGIPPCDCEVDWTQAGVGGVIQIFNGGILLCNGGSIAFR